MKTYKVCIKCLKKKEINLFYVHEKNRDGYRHECKECTKLRTQQWRIDNPELYQLQVERIKNDPERFLYLKKWRLNNPDYHKEWIKRHPDYYKNRSKKKKAQK